MIDSVEYVGEVTMVIELMTYIDDQILDHINVNWHLCFWLKNVFQSTIRIFSNILLSHLPHSRITGFISTGLPLIDSKNFVLWQKVLKKMAAKALVYMFIICFRLKWKTNFLVNKTRIFSDLLETFLIAPGMTDIKTNTIHTSVQNAIKTFFQCKFY